MPYGKAKTLQEHVCIYPRVMGFRTIIDFPIWRLTVLILNSYDDWNFQKMAS